MYCQCCDRRRSPAEFGVCPICCTNTCGVGRCAGECIHLLQVEEAERNVVCISEHEQWKPAHEPGC